jgi:hypothetical protein
LRSFWAAERVPGGREPASSTSDRGGIGCMPVSNRHESLPTSKPAPDRTPVGRTLFPCHAG